MTAHKVNLSEGDLVTYKTIKGRVTAIFSDPALGFVVCIKITSRNHSFYQSGTEITVPLKDVELRGRS